MDRTSERTSPRQATRTRDDTSTGSPRPTQDDEAAAGGRCPIDHGSPRQGPHHHGMWRTLPHSANEGADPVDHGAAEQFLRLYHHETGQLPHLAARLRDVRRSIDHFGTYEHTPQELTFGARVAWRNSNRCIGRLYWRSLQIRDRRHLTTAHDIATECANHLEAAYNGGRIRPLITVFAPDRPGRPGPRIRNNQLVRYAGYRTDDHEFQGDPANIALTDAARALGWTAPGGRFDVLPLLIDLPGEPTHLHTLPGNAVHQVDLVHPTYDWFADLGLRWHAVPAIADMCLEIGGICYRAAPFNGWYMGTEIGARNLADTDRYDTLAEVGKAMGLNLSSDRALWRDKAMIELNIAVLHSFDTAGVAIADHHTEAKRFLRHLEREEQSGRIVPTDWSWIVPPISGSTTPVFHRYYEDIQQRPAFLHHPPAPLTAPGLAVLET